jgi:hypothetical protein
MSSTFWIIKSVARSWWLTSVILATQETEIRKIEVQANPRQIVRETLSHGQGEIKQVEVKG